MKKDYKAGDYIKGDFYGIRHILECRVFDDKLYWNQVEQGICNKNYDKNQQDRYKHQYYLKNLQFATPQEIIAAGFKPQVKTYELW